MKDETFVERVLHRLVKKHISGTTMGSAISKAKELNDKNFLTSITYLSGSADTKAKAKYSTAAYSELIRRVGRLGLKASVHIYAEQLGSNIDRKLFVENVNEVLAAGNRYGVFLWLDLDPSEMYAAGEFEGAKGLGFVTYPENARKYTRLYHAKSLKAVFGHSRAKSDDVLDEVNYLSEHASNLVLASFPESVVSKLLKNGKIKKRLTFEFGLGYGIKKLRKMAKRGASLSVNIPFGKDWTEYASRNLADGYMKFFIDKLLSEEKEERD